MTILLRMDDKMNRQLTCLVSEIDNSSTLAQELVYYGFINEVSFLGLFIHWEYPVLSRKERSEENLMYIDA